MPQMAPISWLTLFILFSITFMMFNTLNYYCFNKSSKKFFSLESSNQKNNNSLNWKW